MNGSEISCPVNGDSVSYYDLRKAFDRDNLLSILRLRWFEWQLALRNFKRRIDIEDGNGVVSFLGDERQYPSEYIDPSCRQLIQLETPAHPLSSWFCPGAGSYIAYPLYLSAKGLNPNAELAIAKTDFYAVPVDLKTWQLYDINQYLRGISAETVWQEMTSEESFCIVTEPTRQDCYEQLIFEYEFPNRESRGMLEAVLLSILAPSGSDSHSVVAARLADLGAADYVSKSRS